MTPEQIETLKKMLSARESARASRESAPQDFATMGMNKESISAECVLVLFNEEADALRSALAMAEQARVMEGWDSIDGYHKGDVRVSMNNDGLWMVDDFPKFVGKDGAWTADLNQTAQFEELHEAIKAANAAMKAGEK
jgi:hypothetical protein